MERPDTPAVEQATEEKAFALPAEERAMFKDSTYEIVSAVAYLIGVPKRIF